MWLIKNGKQKEDIKIKINCKMSLAIIGDFNPSFRPHLATNEAINHSLSALKRALKVDWIPTNTIDANFEALINHYKGFWIAPGSPYNNMAGALKIIEFARLNNVPTLGTCGGFQHIVIEFARHVLGIQDAQHAEYDPYASKLLINPLSCDLKGQKLDITLVDKGSKIYNIFKRNKISEKYYCNFGLNPEYQDLLHNNGLKMVGTDRHKEARILELEGHPFFIATLFVPQDNSSINKPHKLITTFLQAIIKAHGINKSTVSH
jgi:CTP synthase (UTP-ammonia lyase)